MYIFYITNENVSALQKKRFGVLSSERHYGALDSSLPTQCGVHQS